jgi:hypothetical protein
LVGTIAWVAWVIYLVMFNILGFAEGERVLPPPPSAPHGRMGSPPH